MGIPDRDRLENLCQDDMNVIERDVEAIKKAMKKVDEVMPHTWVGRKADRWRTDHQGRMKQLRHLFELFPAEEKKLVEKARRRQEKVDRKTHG